MTSKAVVTKEKSRSINSLPLRIREAAYALPNRLLTIQNLIVLKEEPKNALDDLRSSTGVVVNRNGQQLHDGWFYSPAPAHCTRDANHQPDQRS
jgi:hypothetical protein